MGHDCFRRRWKSQPRFQCFARWQIGWHDGVIRSVVSGFKHSVRNLDALSRGATDEVLWWIMSWRQSADGWVRPSRCSNLLYEVDRKWMRLRESWNMGVRVGEVRWEAAAWHRSIPGCDQPWPWSFSTSPPPTNIQATEIFPRVSPPASAGVKVRWPERITMLYFLWNQPCLSVPLPPCVYTLLPVGVCWERSDLLY